MLSIFFDTENDILFIGRIVEENEEFFSPEPDLVIGVVNDPKSGEKVISDIALLGASRHPILKRLFWALDKSLSEGRALNLIARVNLFKLLEEKHEQDK